MKGLPAKATRQHTKNHNSRLVLRIIYEDEAISRADIARKTGLTRTTVSTVVGELIEQGLIEETGAGQSSGGRLPILLRVAHEAHSVLALSFEDTQIVGALVDMRGSIQRRVSLSLYGYRPEELPGYLTRLIEELRADVTTHILGIGLSMPGIVDPVHGIVRRAVNFGLVDVPLRQWLQDQYRLPVYLDNAAHLAALAEYMFGDGAASGNLVVISIGVGIGAGMVLNGALFPGDGFGAGEIGHVVVADNGIRCNCGNVGCLETVASVPAIVRAARKWFSDPSSRLRALAPSAAAVDLDIVHRALEAGDPGVASVVEEAGYYLGIAIAHIVGLLNVERIVVTGAVAVLGLPFLEAVKVSLARHALAPLAAMTKVELIPERSDAVLLGITAMVLDQELGLLHTRVRLS
ncbi:ROK family transcriptional regulator [Roseiflexus castenholzii]|uniref:ROK family protein n=1 Tax=Roseiflexus castenholzii (strain DSM 13941 / HLO8) TaxID=383372 RepID=A7NGL7_ROSCS|nr:ROK family transcriptional regulator [Roseiflexus castenholzii]ABU56607.1 ROK family protein [Roseiflexus castenholzii DSM 13941]